jgi:Fe-S-cluster-containing hydrogenase component 2
MKPATVRVTLNPQACQGCRACEAVCSLANFGVVNPSCTGIKVMEPGEMGKFKLVICMQCEDMPCAEVCPKKAIVRDAYSGAVTVTGECTGCGLCTSACPPGAIHVIDFQGKKRAFKCTLCGGQPICTLICPRSAIGW